MVSSKRVKVRDDRRRTTLCFVWLALLQRRSSGLQSHRSVDRKCRGRHVRFSRRSKSAGASVWRHRREMSSRSLDREAARSSQQLRSNQSIRRNTRRNPLFDVHQPPRDCALRQFQRRRETLIGDQFVDGGTRQSRHLNDFGKAHQRCGMNFVHCGILGIGSWNGRRALQRPWIFRQVGARASWSARRWKLLGSALVRIGLRSIVCTSWPVTHVRNLPPHVPGRGPVSRQDKAIVEPCSHRRNGVRLSLIDLALLASVTRPTALHRFGESRTERILISRRDNPVSRLGARKDLYVYQLEARDLRFARQRHGSDCQRGTNRIAHAPMRPKSRNLWPWGSSGEGRRTCGGIPP